MCLTSLHSCTAAVFVFLFMSTFIFFHAFFFLDGRETNLIGKFFHGFFMSFWADVWGSKIEESQLQGGLEYVSLPLCFMIICWSVPLGAGRTSEQRLEQDRRTKFGASEEPQHTTHTQDAQRHTTHTLVRTSGGNSGSRWRTILATLSMAAAPGFMYFESGKFSWFWAEENKHFSFLHHSCMHTWQNTTK